MQTQSVRARWSLPVAAAAGLLVSSSLFGANPPVLHMQTEAGRSHLSLGGGPTFRTTADEVVAPRVVTLPGGAAVVLWEERDAAGARHAFYGISHDGARVFRAVETENRVRLAYASFDPLVSTPGIPEGLTARADGTTYLVQFVAPPLESMRAAITQLGGTIHHYLTDHTYMVRLSAPSVTLVRALPFVRWVGPFHTAYKLEAGLLAQAAGPQDDAVPARYSMFLLERGPAAQDRVSAAVRALGGTVNQTLPQGFQIDATLTPADLLQVAAMDDVTFVDRWGPPSAHMNIARELGGANLLETIDGFNGQGVRAEVLDTGLRQTHLAFQNPAPIFHGPNHFDTSHGTMVFGIVFGNGVVVPNGRGLLPGREQGIAASFWLLGDRYVHTSELTAPGGPYRAVFQTNSWSQLPITTQYNSVAATLDDIVFDNDFMILHSQGNYGATNPPQNSGRQAWAKNIISVGGVEHKDTILRSDDEWLGGASIGPASDTRVKPDLTHFYDKVLCPSDTSNTSYTADMGGTSAACPITAGHAGLLYQMWHEGVFTGFGGGASVFADRPHPTVIKALLVNTAYQYPFTAGSNLSRGVQGWGMADLHDVVNGASSFFIVNETDVLTPAASKSYSLKVAPGTPELKITMCYLDPAGNPSGSQARVNDLSLRVTAPGGAVYWGNNGLNDGLHSTPGGVSNKRDTVENVFVLDPAPGNWLVQVLADDLNTDARVETPGVTDADFALVAHPVEFVQPMAITLPQGVPSLVAPGVPAPINLTISSVSQNPVPSTATLHYRLTGTGAFNTVPMQHLGGSDYKALLPAPLCGNTPQFYFSVQGDGGGSAVEPVNAPVSFYSTLVGSIQILHTDNFEEDAQWAVQNTSVSAGAWERGVPEGGGAQGDPASDFDGSGKCWVTGLAPSVELNGGPTVLVTRPFNLVGFGQAEFSYARWAYTNDPTPADDLKVSISNDNGQNWVSVETVGGLINQWVVRSFKLADYFTTPGNQVRLRFSISDNPVNSLTEGGLDAFLITARVCSNPCYADCTQSGGLTIQDFACFQNAFVAGQAYADCNSSGTLTIADFACFQTKFVQGCP